MKIINVTIRKAEAESKNLNTAESITIGDDDVGYLSL
jgi:hypothetical protein